MPAFATHFFFAKDVLANIENDELKKMIDKYRDFYDLGAQGPDIFFYYKPYKRNNIAQFGVNMHKNNPKQVIYNGIKNIKEYENNPYRKLRTYEDVSALVYLFGFVTHFTLDSNFHPYIDKVTTNSSTHYLLEAQLDRKFIEMNIKNIKPENYKRNLLISVKPKMYGLALNLIYPEIKSTTLDEVVYQTDSYMRLLNTNNKLFINLLSFFSKKLVDNDHDFSNLIIKKQQDHTYDKAIEELLKLYDDVVKQAVDNINNVYEYYLNDKKLNNNFEKKF